MNKSVLITGGAGFIGSHTCLALLDSGYKIFIIDSFENSSIETIDLLKKYSNNSQGKLIDFFEGSICDLKILEEVFEKSRELSQPINAVIHFAGLKSVSCSIKDPIRYWHNNVFGTLNLIKVMNNFDCRTMVFSSSATVYGDYSESPISENASIDSINCYGSTKVAIEKLLFDVFKSNPKKWKICSLRYFNPIGAHPLGNLGENCINKPSNIFPNICKAASGSINSLKIYGKDWPTPDGTCIRDYIHIMDLAAGHLASLNYLERNIGQFTPINLGTGKGTSVLELVKTFENENEIKVPYKFVERRLGDSPVSFADNRFALKHLDWEPKYDLKDMCKHGWEYIKKIEQF